ncbi:MAG: phage/plasmid primase, P4 family [Sneathiella sp.]
MAEKDIRDIVNSANVVDFSEARKTADAEELDRRLVWYDRNDYGNGQRLIVRFGENLLYIPGLDWFVWDGKRWHHDTEGMAARRTAHKVARAIRDEYKTMNLRELAEKIQEKEAAVPGGPYEAAAKAIEAHKRWAVNSGNQARASAMLGEAAPYIASEAKILDADDHLLTVENGTLELASKGAEKSGYVVMREHDRRDRITAKAAVTFSPEATAPTWQRFLETILPDPEVRLFVQRYYGYVLTGSQGEQCLCLFYGGGANGKSTLMDVIADIMGDYSKVLPFASLLHDDKKRGSEASPDLARLPGARYVRASEPDAGVRFSESLIKTVTGGEEITARMLNKDFFEFRPQFKLVLAFNNRPSIRGGDHGIWRRIKMVPFEVSIPKEEQDPNLKDKLLAESSGILNWMLDGYRDWREKGLAPPAAIAAATEEYKAEQNPLGEFVKDCVQTTEGERVSATRLYEVYNRWCEENSHKPMSTTLFGRLLPDQGLTKIKYGVIYYDNIILSEFAEDLMTPIPAQDA